MPATGWWRNLPLWRGAAGAGALATVLAVVTTVGLRDRLGAQIDGLQAKLSAQLPGLAGASNRLVRTRSG